MNSTGKHHRAMDAQVREAMAKATLYGILDTGYVAPSNLLHVAGELVESGVQVLQLRAKNVDRETIVPLARSIASLCRLHLVPFILNDYPELVASAGADGVHVGQDDCSISAAREAAGSWCLVGKSTHSLSQAREAAKDGADYIGFGPLFPTPTKPDYPSIGLDSIHEVHATVDIPIFCIGGIKRENLPGVLDAGAKRVVIVSGLLQAPDIRQMVSDCRGLLANHGTTPAMEAKK